MGIFSKNQEINSKEYEKVLISLAEVKNELENCKRSIKNFELDMEDLRNKVLRKIRIPKEEEEKHDIGIPKAQNLSSLKPFG